MELRDSDVRAWLKNAQRLGALYLLVALDQWTDDAYPLYVWPGESLSDRLTEWQALPGQIIERVILVSPMR